MGRPLIFLSCGATVVPLVPHLAARYRLVVPNDAVAQQLCAQGIVALAAGSLIDPAAAQRLLATSEGRCRRWEAHLSAVASDLFPRRFVAEFLAAGRDVLQRQLSVQLSTLAVARSLLATGHLGAMVVHEDVTGAARVLLAAARGAGVPTVHVPHGIYVKERIAGADVHGTLQADVAAVAGPVAREWFVGRGVPADRLVATGNPAWDRLCGAQPSPAASHEPLVVFAASWLGPEMPARGMMRAQHDRWTTAAFAGVATLRRRLPSLRLVVKMHPSATPAEEDRLRRLAAPTGVTIDAVRTGDPVPLLGRADALVSLPSTIVIESMLIGTPVVVPEAYYDTDAVLTTPATPEAVAAALERVLGGWGTSTDFAARRAEFIARYNGPCDGRAAERVAALVEDMVARHAPLRRTAETPRAGAAARVRLGVATLVSGDPADAEAVLGEAVALDGDRAEAWSAFGVAAALQGDRAESVRRLERALVLDPSCTNARRALDALLEPPGP